MRGTCGRQWELRKFVWGNVNVTIFANESIPADWNIEPCVRYGTTMQYVSTSVPTAVQSVNSVYSISCGV